MGLGGTSNPESRRGVYSCGFELSLNRDCRLGSPC